VEVMVWYCVCDQIMFTCFLWSDSDDRMYDSIIKKLVLLFVEIYFDLKFLILNNHAC
jgi:hypothetical protein